MNDGAFRIDGRHVDAAAFYAVACDPARSVVVEACAGSGKTWMLVSRILRALLDGAAPQEILAITFTRKAAAEMRERLAKWLRDFAAADAATLQAELRQRGLGAADAERLAPWLAALHAQALHASVPVAIQTFHGWFSQLLGAAPIALRSALQLPAQGELIESTEDHHDEVHRRFHAVLLGRPDLRAEHAALVARRGRHAVRGWLDAVLMRRIEFELADEAGVLEASVPPAAAHWPELAGLAHPVERLRRGAWPARLAELMRALDAGGANARKAAAELASAVSIDDADACFAALWRALFTQEDTPRKNLGTVAGLAEVQDEFETLAEQVLAHVAHAEHVAMTRLGRVLLAEFAAYKRERSLIDMGDLERAALALLRDAELAGWVQERLDARIRHLLIDEFQDTSPLQWQALAAWLAGYAGAGGGASGQRPLSVFIVGDPKQSIYRFRRAEPRVFLAAREFVVEGLEGHVLECDHTRRSAVPVVEAVNRVFSKAGDEGAFAGFRPHTTASEADGAVRCLPRQERPPSARAGRVVEPVWRDSLSEARREPETVLRDAEAAGIAAAIAALIHAGGLKPGDVMVLARRREPLGAVADALRQRGIAFAAAQERTLAEAPEVLDLTALLDALVSPRHRLALARALRSPVFGASDDDLIDLTLAAGDGGDWWGALMTLPAPSPALARARELLRVWRDAARQLPAHDLLDRIVAEGEVVERYAAAVPPSARAAALDAIDALLAQALDLDGGRQATPYRFVRALRQQPLRFTPPAHADAVQLLTIHGAKGLEARAVFVVDADPNRTNDPVGSALIDWPAEAQRPRRFALIYTESRCPRALSALLDEEREARAREELNALYVAMTRARETLVFSATAPYQAGPQPSWWARVAPLATPYEPPAAADSAAPAWVPLRLLPPLPPRAQPVAVADDGDPARAAIGRAVHRCLEWYRPGADLAALARSAAAEFGAEAEAVCPVAQRIVSHPDTAALFDASRLEWAGNEVSVGDGGRTQRIDRLVLLESDGRRTWWVLDYKLRHDPQALEAYRSQLLAYRDLVQRAQPGDGVRCAFIAGSGERIEIAPGSRS